MSAVLFEEEANRVRDLMMIDKETKAALGGPPYSEDIRAELVQAYLLDTEQASKTSRRRVRLGRMIAEDEYGFPIAYIGYTVVRNARPIDYELTHVHSGRYPVLSNGRWVPVNGIFIRRLVTHPNVRGKGLAEHLLRSVRDDPRFSDLPLFCDTKADNHAMRRLARKAGGQESSFWYTPSGTLMVRYLVR